MSSGFSKIVQDYLLYKKVNIYYNKDGFLCALGGSNTEEI
jgi:hypothetical protein